MNKSYRNKLQSGFTLIEIMVVVVIIAILAAVVVPRIMSRPEQARKVKAKTDIMQIQSAMDLYKLDNGFYPSAEQGIAALVRKPNGDPQPQEWQVGGYLKEIPSDPWGHGYHYANPGQHSSVDIWTDGASNTPGKDTIGNWKD
jgi:general secretion pathway protein G